MTSQYGVVDISNWS